MKRAMKRAMMMMGVVEVVVVLAVVTIMGCQQR
jgi:hypothetical protein